MIQVIQRGLYKLLETKHQTKILLLDKKAYAWINAGEIGEILVTSLKKHYVDTILCVGNYRLYDVKYEPDFSDQQHLELHVGIGTWQGYLLPTGLPSGSKKRKRIIPTKELISVPIEQVFPQEQQYLSR